MAACRPYLVVARARKRRAGIPQPVWEKNHAFLVLALFSLAIPHRDVKHSGASRSINRQASCTRTGVHRTGSARRQTDVFFACWALGCLTIYPRRCRVSRIHRTSSAEHLPSCRRVSDIDSRKTHHFQTRSQRSTAHSSNSALPPHLPPNPGSACSHHGKTRRGKGNDKNVRVSIGPVWRPNPFLQVDAHGEGIFCSRWPACRPAESLSRQC
ncbi:hypothetical protein LX32DRAFT_420701 [Colletotrichum zoysiae]|uniref:Uncharacterized protein n=1 Tax=Colletotrichum zoysiae TaxID=1216348 RepID=A0AAD9HUX9_9PEZI|nr:hypothetical protein LX32DRAFT_420701 [Colletotrichum zoysiae]